MYQIRHSDAERCRLDGGESRLIKRELNKTRAEKLWLTGEKKETNPKRDIKADDGGQTYPGHTNFGTT